LFVCLSTCLHVCGCVKVRYHEEFEKKIKGSKIEVVDDPESKRLKRLGSLVSQVEYKKTASIDSDTRRRASLTNYCMFIAF